MNTGCCTKPLSRVLKRREEENFHWARSCSIYIGVLHRGQAFGIGTSATWLAPAWLAPAWLAQVLGSAMVLRHRDSAAHSLAPPIFATRIFAGTPKPYGTVTATAELASTLALLLHWPLMLPWTLQPDVVVVP